MKSLCLAALASVGLTGFAHAADVLPTTKTAPAAPENCFASIWTYLDFDRRRLSVVLRTVHPLRDARRRAHVRHQRRAVEPGLRQRHPGADQQAEQRPEMAVVAEQHQSVGHRHQNVAADRQRLVAHRHARGGLRSPVGLSVQLPTRASDEQRQAALGPERERQTRAAPGNGTIRNFSSASATRLTAR